MKRLLTSSLWALMLLFGLQANAQFSHPSSHSSSHSSGGGSHSSGSSYRSSGSSFHSSSSYHSGPSYYHSSTYYRSPTYYSNSYSDFVPIKYYHPGLNAYYLFPPYELAPFVNTNTRMVVDTSAYINPKTRRYTIKISPWVNGICTTQLFNPTTGQLTYTQTDHQGNELEYSDIRYRDDKTVSKMIIRTESLYNQTPTVTEITFDLDNQPISKVVYPDLGKNIVVNLSSTFEWDKINHQWIQVSRMNPHLIDPVDHQINK